MEILSYFLTSPLQLAFDSPGKKASAGARGALPSRGRGTRRFRPEPWSRAVAGGVTNGWDLWDVWVSI
jgi:hypothetical protein